MLLYLKVYVFVEVHFGHTLKLHSKILVFWKVTNLNLFLTPTTFLIKKVSKSFHQIFWDSFFFSLQWWIRCLKFSIEKLRSVINSWFLITYQMWDISAKWLKVEIHIANIIRVEFIFVMFNYLMYVNFHLSYWFKWSPKHICLSIFYLKSNLPVINWRREKLVLNPETAFFKINC